jgi:sulfate permease, SulP family
VWKVPLSIDRYLQFESLTWSLSDGCTYIIIDCINEMTDSQRLAMLSSSALSSSAIAMEPPILFNQDWFFDHIPIAPVSLPILEWLPKYDRKTFLQDLVAGLTVFVFLVPQGMAYAILSGLPAVYGLYSATIPLFVFAIFTTSHQLAMGPMAITSLLLGVTCQKYGFEEASPEYITAALSISMMIGFILIFLGLGRLGSLSNLISHSVLVGFLTASALVIAITQFKYLFGIKIPRFQYNHQVILYIIEHIHDTNLNDFLVGFGMLGILVGLREWKKRNKGKPQTNIVVKILGIISNLSNFLAIVLGSLIAKGIIDQGGDIRIVGVVPSGVHSPQFNLVDFPTWLSMIPASCAIAFVSFAGNWAVATKYAQINKYRVEATQELVASGLAVVIGVLFNSFVVSGGLARTAVNAESGAQTQMSMCICGALILLSLLTLTSFFYYIPMCVLSAVIEVSVISMIDFESMFKAYRIDKRDCAVMFVTFFVTFFLGITEGLFAGIFLSVVMVMQSTSFPHIAHVGQLPTDEGGYFRDIHRYPQAMQLPGIAIVRMDASPLFSNSHYFLSVVKSAMSGKHHTSTVPIKAIVIDCSAWIDIDLVGIQTMNELKVELTKADIRIAIACAKGVIRDRLRDNGFLEGLMESCFFVSIDDAVQNHPATTSSKSAKNSPKSLPHDYKSSPTLVEMVKGSYERLVHSQHEIYSVLHSKIGDEEQVFDP